jgi:IS1 family transposase
VALYTLKKNKLWIWKAYCRTTGTLIDWELGDRSSDTLWPLLERLSEYDVVLFFADHWESYEELIPPEKLVQTKAETHGIERNNSQQRHWFARFRRRTCVVSRSIEMVELTTALFAWFHSKEGKKRLFDLRIS